jgi:hypothetical protein
MTHSTLALYYLVFIKFLIVVVLVLLGIKQDDHWVCKDCGILYGDPQDPKSTDSWLTCVSCKVHLHDTCAELNGIIDDDDQFFCKSCVY